LAEPWQPDSSDLRPAVDGAEGPRARKSSEAAKIGGVTLQIVRDWVLKFNARGSDGLVDRKAPGQPGRLQDEHRGPFAAILDSGPIPAVHGVVRWRVIDLCQWMWEELRVSIAKSTLSRELRAMGYRSSPPGPGTMPKLMGPLRLLKKVPRLFRQNRLREGHCARRHCRSVVNEALIHCACK
jgi:transposase